MYLSPDGQPLSDFGYGRGPAGAGESGCQRHAVPQGYRHLLRCSGGHQRQETRNIREADLSALPVGERTILELVALRLLCAVAPPYIYNETSVTVDCTGAEFTAKGRTVKQPGWRALDAAYRASMKNAEPDKEAEDKALPELTEGQELPVTGAAVKEGKTTRRQGG